MLDLYRVVPGGLSDEQWRDALAAADTAALLLGHRTAYDAGWFDHALGHRAEIHQATGMVLAQLGTSAAGDIIDMLDQLLAHCVAMLDADEAGLMLGNAYGQLRVAAASSADARIMEMLQLQADEGPCLEAYRTMKQVRVPDLAGVAERWPTFVAAVERGGAFRSVHALPLRLRGQAIGAVNLFQHTSGPLADADLALGQALVDVATIGILSERAIRRGEIVDEQLQTALRSRVIVEQAKGVLAERLGVEMDVTLERLRRYARAHDLRLAEAARRVVHGEFDVSALTT